MSRAALIVFVVVHATATCAAQLDRNGPNAVLTLNGVEPSVADPLDHDVEILAPGALELKITSGVNPNQAVVLFATPHDPLAPEFATPWGGSLDFPIANGILVGSGLDAGILNAFYFTDIGNPYTGEDPTFRLNFQIASNLVGSRVAFQAVVQDPSALFGLDNTEIGDANFIFGNDISAQVGEDGSVEVPFVVPHTVAGTQTFEFHGLSYTSVHVAANGFVTFGGGTTLTNAGFDNDHVAWVADQPAIAAVLADWSPTGNGAADGIRVRETQGQVRIAWGDPATTTGGGIPHFNDDDANRFEIVLQLADGLNEDAGCFSVFTEILDPDAAVDNGNGLIGHTAGGAMSIAQDLSLRSNTNVGGIGVPQVEEHDALGNNASRVGWDALGTPRTYNDVTTNWNGAQVNFTPNAPFAVAGDAGYTSTPDAVLPPDDVKSIDLSNVLTTGGETVRANGSFFGFDEFGTGAGKVTFDPLGLFGGPFIATIVGILDGTGGSGALAMANPQPGPVRDGQGLVFTTPALPAPGNYDVEFDFESGFSRTLQVTVTLPDTIQTGYQLGDDAVVQHTLGPGVDISFMGARYTSFFICSNGFIEFNVPRVDVNPVVQDFWDGYVAGPHLIRNFGVAAFWTDLNQQVGLNGSSWDVTEDTLANTVTVSFTNQEYWFTNEPAGTATVTFGAPTTANPTGTGNVAIDLTQTTPAGAMNTQQVLFGVTDGDSALNGLGLGGETDFTTGPMDGTGLFTTIDGPGSYTSPASFDSVAELFLANQPLPYTTAIEFSDLNGSGLWLIDLAP